MGHLFIEGSNCFGFHAGDLYAAFPSRISSRDHFDHFPTVFGFGVLQFSKCKDEEARKLNLCFQTGSQFSIDCGCCVPWPKQ